MQGTYKLRKPSRGAATEPSWWSRVKNSGARGSLWPTYLLIRQRRIRVRYGLAVMRSHAVGSTLVARYSFLLDVANLALLMRKNCASQILAATAVDAFRMSANRATRRVVRHSFSSVWYSSDNYVPHGHHNRKANGTPDLCTENSKILSRLSASTRTTAI